MENQEKSGEKIKLEKNAVIFCFGGKMVKKRSKKFYGRKIKTFLEVSNPPLRHFTKRSR
jgi:hypothetical protein